MAAESIFISWMMPNLRSLFLLRPDVAYLNHGSFGATPRPVFEEYQRFQAELEAEPMEFIARRGPALMHEARSVAAAYLGCDPLDMVFVTNATIGVNIVARSLVLGPGDEVLGTDQEYGACDRTLTFLSRKAGFTYRLASLPVPPTTPEELAESFMAQVTPATRAILISHIAAPTALTFPVREICALARERGIITLVDGAHVPGQLPLNLTDVGADFYTGNLHKWLCAPKGAAFLYARREMQPLLEPLVVSWGYDAVVPGPSRFVDHQEMWGTRDLAPFLAVPAAIRFQQEHDWDAVREECHRLLLSFRPEIADALGGQPVAAEGEGWFRQMSAFRIPAGVDGFELGRRLFDEHLVEIPVFQWMETQLLRISIQGYNTRQDVERLLSGLRAILGR